MKLLVTGGAGYVGSVTSRLLLDAGHQVVVLDNLRTGFREAVTPDATFVEADIAEAGSVLTPDAGFDAVLHFAGLIAAGESMVKPELYWDHNVIRSLRLLEAVQAAKVQSPRAAEELDLALRRALFCDSRHIGMRHEILDVARTCPSVDVDDLTRALDDGSLRWRVIADWHEAEESAVEEKTTVGTPAARTASSSASEPTTLACQ